MIGGMLPNSLPTPPNSSTPQSHKQALTLQQLQINNWGLFLFLLAVRCVSLFSWFSKEDSNNSFFQMWEGIACVAQEHDDLENWTNTSNKKKNFRCREIQHAFTHHYDKDTAYYGQFSDTEIKIRQLMWENWRLFLMAICPDYLWKNTSRGVASSKTCRPGPSNFWFDHSTICNKVCIVGVC